MDITSYDSSSLVIVLPTSAGADGTLVFATAFDGTAATSVASSTSAGSSATAVTSTTSTTSTGTLTAISQLPSRGVSQPRNLPKFNRLIYLLLANLLQQYAGGIRIARL